MAISVPSLLTSGTAQSSSSPQTTATVTPAANALLLVWQWVGTATTITTAPTFTAPTTSLSGVGTWASYSTTATAGRSWRGNLWFAQLGSAPGSGTISLNASGSVQRWAWIVAAVTGHNTTTPVRQGLTGTGTATTLLLTLASAPLADSMVMGAIGSHGQDGGITPGAGFIEIAESGIIESSGHNAQMQYSSPPDSTCDWSALDPSANVAAVIEIAAAPVAPPPPPPAGTGRPRITFIGL